MGAFQAHLSLVSDRAVGSGSAVLPLRAQPVALIATTSPERYSDLVEGLDFVPDVLEAIATAITVRYPVILADISLGAGYQSGYQLAKELRAYRVSCPIFIVTDYPLPSDRRHALNSGATDLLVRDRAVLREVICGGSVTQRGAEVAEPPWLGKAVAVARRFFASEADAHVRAIFHSLRQRRDDVSWSDVMSETGQLLDDLDDRKVFMRLAAASAQQVER